MMVAAAAFLWGTIGIYIDFLNQHGFSSLEIVAFRVLTATVILFLYLLFRDRSLLSVQFYHLHYFIGTGILSISFFNWSYFTAISETSLSVAVVLLYTGPAFVVIMSRLFFSELLTPQKVIALFLTVIGVALVADLFSDTGRITLFGAAVGISAGFGYALYTIFSKVALKKYPPLTIIFYTFLMASLFMVPFSGITGSETMIKLQNFNVLIVTICLGLFPTVLAYLLYTEGLKKIEAGKASITAMIEPVSATLIGVILYGELLSPVQISGVLIVLLSVMLIQIRYKTMSVSSENPES
jgi:drug/metabolite transporter, DME family